MLSSLTASAGAGAQLLTGMPYASRTTDKVFHLVSEINDLRERIAHLESECAHEKGKIIPYIDAIKDDQTRMMFHLRFLRCLSWEQVADMLGGKNTANGVKMRCYRYLRH